MRNTRLGMCLFTLPIIAILIGLGGCQKEAAPPPPKTAQTTPPLVPEPKPKVRPWIVMCAYQPIAMELSTMTQIQDDTVWAGRPINVGWIVKPVVIAASGVGMANAAATTQFLIDRFNPVGIILAGVATPLDPAHKIGDLIIPDRWLSYDFGYWGKDGFKLDSVPVGKTDGSGFNRMLEIQADTALIRMLNTAADATAFTLRTVGHRLPEIHKGGLGLSGDGFVDSKPKRDQLRKQLKAEISDTESAAVVQTARAAGVPVAVIRACAATAGEGDTPESQDALRDFFTASAHNTALVLRSFLENLPKE